MSGACSRGSGAGCAATYRRSSISRSNSIHSGRYSGSGRGACDVDNDDYGSERSGSSYILSLSHDRRGRQSRTATPLKVIGWTKTREVDQSRLPGVLALTEVEAARCS